MKSTMELMHFLAMISLILAGLAIIVGLILAALGIEF